MAVLLEVLQVLVLVVESVNYQELWELKMTNFSVDQLYLYYYC